MNKKATLFSSIRSLGLVLFFWLAIRWLLLEPYVIPSGSMLPNLLINDNIVVNKIYYGVRLPFTKNWLIRFNEVKRGDIVVFRSVNNDDFFLVKRVVAVGGDSVAMTEKGSLVINGSELAIEPASTSGFKENYKFNGEDLPRELRSFNFKFEVISGDDSNGNSENQHKVLIMNEKSERDRSFAEVKVPKGRFMVMGDNRDNSHDSRFWGSVPESNILGKASFVWLSCLNKGLSAGEFCDFSQVRWDRFFYKVK